MHAHPRRGPGRGDGGGLTARQDPFGESPSIAAPPGNGPRQANRHRVGPGAAELDRGQMPPVGRIREAADVRPPAEGPHGHGQMMQCRTATQQQLA
ncbi:hypothetical protein ACFOS0_15600 [Nocardia seriolae]|uniref:hypothetical protein n=1 Tax=Nocardia seriolae TaxID=37332 RepID=UPI00078726A6|nr:hypothetical protein [Nocardia seriolae]